MGTILLNSGLTLGESPEIWNITNPKLIESIHHSYYEAGSNIVITNTFGANSLKFSDKELEKIIGSAVENAMRAREVSSGKQAKFVALDIGPCGKLLKPYGDLEFKDALSIFSKTVKLGEKFGVDLIFIETMFDINETKAALLAAKENSNLPVFVSNTYGKDGKLMTGATPFEIVKLVVEIGADAIGANCSFGPKQLKPVIKELLKYSSIPVLLKANAGLPREVDGKSIYDILPDEFACDIAEEIKEGVRIVGGCCGTTPEYIKAIVDKTKNINIKA
jgi:5-methyltetrahydrofolate--homocysteine methyltransferase